MKILIKIDKIDEEKNLIAARFCSWKSQKSINAYRRRTISSEHFDRSNIINFCEDLGKSGSREIESNEKDLPTLPDNDPIELNDEMSIKDIIDKVICVNYPPKKIKKLKVRRVEL